MIVNNFENFEEGFFIMECINKALVRNYIRERLLTYTMKQIKDYREKNKNKTIYIIGVFVERTNAENYAIHIKYATNSWVKEYTDDLILWEETRIPNVKVNYETKFHFLIQEYKQFNIKLKEK